MHILFSDPQAVSDYENLPRAVQAQAEKQFGFLLKNLRHPSLRAKKYDEAENKWQARINSRFRFYFWINGNVYSIMRITKHPK